MVKQEWLPAEDRAVGDCGEPQNQKAEDSGDLPTEQAAPSRLDY